MHPSLSYSPQMERDAARTPFLYPANPDWLARGRIIVEVGPGRGDFLFHLAQSNPNASVVGIEIKRKRVDKLIRRVERRGLSNVTIVQDDARAAMPRIFPEGSVDEIHINFPDPWPKKRHAKNRAVNRALLAECARVLKKGGTLAIATDHEPYFADMTECAREVPNLVKDPVALERPLPDIFPTLFANRWRAEGRRIMRLILTRA